MGAIPLSLGDTDDIDWLPVDSAAQAIVECTLSNVGRSEAQSPDVFHIINPKTGSWRGLVPVIQELYRREQGIVLEAVAFDDWVAALKRVPLTREQVEIKPGLKLIGFYESMAGLFPVVDIQKTVKYSKSLAESRPVDEALLKKWLRHWI
ncbi:NRPS-like enzyme [Neofusicoccum parvum]|nr:NRPS-like enzyme [Neofusicoccum parvum]